MGVEWSGFRFLSARGVPGWWVVALALCWTARLGMPPKFSRPQVEAVLVARIEAEFRLQESTTAWQDATERAKHRKAMEWATLANNDVSLVNAAKHQWGRLFGTVEFKSEEAEMPESRKQRRLRSVRDWMAEEGAKEQHAFARCRAGASSSCCCCQLPPPGLSCACPYAADPPPVPVRAGQSSER